MYAYSIFSLLFGANHSWGSLVLEVLCVRKHQREAVPAAAAGEGTPREGRNNLVRFINKLVQQTFTFTFPLFPFFFFLSFLSGAFSLKWSALHSTSECAPGFIVLDYFSFPLLLIASRWCSLQTFAVSAAVIFGQCVPDTDSVRANEWMDVRCAVSVLSLLTPNCNSKSRNAFSLPAEAHTHKQTFGELICHLLTTDLVNDCQQHWSFQLAHLKNGPSRTSELMNGAGRWRKSDLHFNCSYDNAPSFYFILKFTFEC